MGEIPRPVELTYPVDLAAFWAGVRMYELDPAFLLVPRGALGLICLELTRRRRGHGIDGASD